MTSNQTSKEEMREALQDQITHINGWCFHNGKDCPVYDSYLVYEEGDMREDTAKMLEDIMKAIDSYTQSILEEVIQIDGMRRYTPASKSDIVSVTSAAALNSLVERQWLRASKYGYKNPEGKERS